MTYGDRIAQRVARFLDLFADLYLAVIALGVGGLFTFWGGRGLRAYVAGVRAAWTEPWVCFLGVVAGAWMLLVSVRLFRGAGRHGLALLTQGELLALSLGALGGSLWMFTIAPPRQAWVFLAVSLAGLGLWWVRQRAGRPKVAPPAA